MTYIVSSLCGPGLFVPGWFWSACPFKFSIYFTAGELRKAASDKGAWYPSLAFELAISKARGVQSLTYLRGTGSVR